MTGAPSETDAHATLSSVPYPVETITKLLVAAKEGSISRLVISVYPVGTAAAEVKGMIEARRVVSLKSIMLKLKRL